ncbi:GNAT family N-acetyltransferase [Isoptericola sp. NPDC056578]|uniref:GNAT family N-acetyltransferase n=1 Tax=unclassified Isoptericola TaxID=2623355 RepID=UPI0036CC82AE
MTDDAAPHPSPAEPTVVPLTEPAQLDSLWRHVLAPSFPPDELTSSDDLRAGLAAGGLTAYGVEQDGTVVAGIVASWSRATQVLLVDYLALAPGHRGGGLGGRLLDRSLAGWREELHPVLVLAEVEHPGHHAPHPSHGDPAARLRFYTRHGARVLAVPYFQPGIGGPGSPRVPAMLLMALGTGPGADSVPAAAVRGFLLEHLRECEGTVPGDPAVRRLLEAAAGETVPLVDAADAEALAAVPVAVLEGAERYAPPAPAPSDPTGSEASEGSDGSA